MPLTTRQTVIKGLTQVEDLQHSLPLSGHPAFSQVLYLYSPVDNDIFPHVRFEFMSYASSRQNILHHRSTNFCIGLLCFVLNIWGTIPRRLNFLYNMTSFPAQTANLRNDFHYSVTLHKTPCNPGLSSIFLLHFG